MIVRFTPPARAQLLAVAAYIHAHRPAAARAFRERADRAYPGVRRFIQTG